MAGETTPSENEREGKTNMNGRELRKLFQEFNQRYFGGKLPAYSVRFVSRDRGFAPPRLGLSSSPAIFPGTQGYCHRSRRLIEIREGLARQETVSTLLHEMAHAATEGAHGMPWRREMLRLRELGAPLHGEDANVQLEWSHDDLSPRQMAFWRVAEELLMNEPQASLARTIEHFWLMEGFAHEDEPWAPDMFERLKCELAEEARMEGRKS
jgi:hypothetical protein